MSVVVCEEHKILNPISGRCVNRNGTVGRELTVAELPPAQLKALTKRIETTANEIDDALDANQIRVETRELTQMYTRMRKIGAGTFGEIYRTYRKLSGGKRRRLVALKVLDFHRINPNAKARELERYLTEAANEIQVQLMLQCPPKQTDCAIIPIYDFFRSDEHKIYIEMKLVQGVDARQITDANDLHDYLWDMHVLYPNFVRICKTMERLHALDILHRDIKPDNLLYEHQTQLMYLIDFGSACVEECGGLVGTELYFDPRFQFGNLESPDRASDVYDLGLSFMECLTRTDIWLLDQDQDVDRWDTVEQLERTLEIATTILKDKLAKYRADEKHISQEDFDHYETMHKLVIQMIRITCKRPSFQSIVKKLNT